MEIAPKKYYIVLRVCLTVSFLFFEFLFGVAIVNAVQENAASLWMWLRALLVQCVMIFFFLWLLGNRPWVAFAKEKIQVMLIFRTKEYLWTDLKQIGILNGKDNGEDYPDLVILLPGGIARKPYDLFFKLKNIGRLIHIPNTPPVRAYIAQCYGPLDFDAFDGKPET